MEGNTIDAEATRRNRSCSSKGTMAKYLDQSTMVGTRGMASTSEVGGRASGVQARFLWDWWKVRKRGQGLRLPLSYCSHLD